ncbi:carbohydrate esterase family 3 protein [Annulohypoxylon maeteangense]|uniref:carbohydrate esterase family 3 protein n=1 Tax=Annulohypoxylon maeteangense TaxID=1927788 RepID=UPI002008B0B8|nr:carbohydrate esterase family 3 protein [Annulohypoxylon maeteangense]KAI0890441.1 carbohydrate esterase family 3 protein [Annulohypoxylon maeteangense]
MKLRWFLAGTCMVATVSSQTRLKIMPLGDNLTELTCWRAKLWDDLKANNMTDRVEFVGSVNNTQGCDTAGEDFAKQHHEGHSGYLAIDIAYDHIENWINETKPDIVTFMLGTDDIARGRRLEDVVEAYTNMVKTMRQHNEYMKIIVNTIVPLPTNMEPVNNLNSMIPDWAQEQNKTESPIYVNDIYPFPNTFLKDGIYPNDDGEKKIVGGLSPLLRWIINSNATGNGTTLD